MVTLIYVCDRLLAIMVDGSLLKEERSDISYVEEEVDEMCL